MDRPSSHLVQVEIYGQSYNLRGEGATAYLQELASYVDRRMREVAEATATVDSLKVAILAALNIADESQRGRPPAVDVVPGGADRLGRMIDTLDRCLASA
ncbi:MAG TPA: cell division protein ZapA [Patescibacteria group bacterium]|nr:cell division protein ZapA [Patescibacteria group bacterium]